jgi:hypothetical protein
MEETRAAAAVAVGNLNPHHAEREQFVDQRRRELRVLVHLAHQRADFLVGELVHAVAQEPFVLGERRQRLHHSNVTIDASCARSGSPRTTSCSTTANR